MYFTVTKFCWCIELSRECWMRLVYHREIIPERGVLRDFLVSATRVTAPVARSQLRSCRAECNSR